MKYKVKELIKTIIFIGAVIVTAFLVSRVMKSEMKANGRKPSVFNY